MSLARFLSFSALGVFLSALVPFFGAPLLRVLRNQWGPAKYWVFVLFFSSALLFSGGFMLALIILSNWLLIEIFAQFEERGWGSSVYSGLVAILTCTALTFLAPGLWEKFTHQPVENDMRQALDRMIETLQAQPAQKEGLEIVGIKMETLAGLLPSILAILFLLNLASALVFDRRVARLMGIKFERTVGTGRPLEFKLPPVFVWLTIVSFLFSFWEVGVPHLAVVSLNVFQFMVAVFFFQGLAIVECAFLAFRVGPISRLIFYILVVGNLFFLLSLLGLADFWVEFRERLRKHHLKQKSE